MIKLKKSTFYRETKTKRELAQFIRSSKVLSMDQQCFRFEKEFSKKQKRKYSVFVNSGSSANLVLMQSLLNLGLLKKGDAVAVSSLTWATNVMPLIQLGLVPVLLDCELETLNTPTRLLAHAAKKRKIRAAFITNTLGFASDLDEMKRYCEQHDILLLEDNCEALGSRLGGTLLGNFGLASTFSTFVGHHLSTIEGGVICTDDKALAEMFNIVRAHGWDRHLPAASKAALRRKHGVEDFYSLYTFYDLAYNVRPTEVQGFVGNSQIGYWDRIVTARSKNFHAFSEKVRQNPDMIPLDVGHMDLVSNFAMPLVFKTKQLCEQYKKRFRKAGVEIRPIIAGHMGHQPFFKKYITKSGACANAALIHDNGFYFGNNPELTRKEVALLSSLLEPLT